MFTRNVFFVSLVLALPLSAPVSAALFCGLPITLGSETDVRYRYVHDATNAYDFFVVLGVIAKADQFAQGKLVDDGRQNQGPYGVRGSEVEYETYLDCPKGGRLFTKAVVDGSYEHWLDSCKFSNYTVSGGYSHFTLFNQQAVVRDIDVDLMTVGSTVSVRGGEYVVPLGDVSAVIPPGTKSVSFDSLTVTGSRSMEINGFKSGISWVDGSRSKTELSAQFELVAAGGQPIAKLVETSAPLVIDRWASVIDSGEILLSDLSGAEEGILSISDGTVSSVGDILGLFDYRISSCLPRRHFLLHYNVFDTI